ncbi:uncharacterized protein LOC133519246 [Cydia pomonella]|uniref:uncharacterized protein LOC133519246 n=1 Tax=Cydia pomonella TaxID=82600 RepID=UPI002ADE4FFD|nr:uncharacterized protein LOC133519246 [Cydia pomonella]
MRAKIVISFLICFVAVCDAFPESQSVEARGKKKKIALFIYFADLVLKKFFILKLIYAFVFWLIIHKAGYFLTWFVSYLKEAKKDHHDHDHVHYGPHHYDDGPSYGPPSYGPSYGPYKRKNY